VNAGDLHPLRFEPIFQYRLWGGRDLGPWLGAQLPGEGPIGEAWVLSDRDDHPSRVAEGALEGVTLTELMTDSRVLLLGDRLAKFNRFPLLLKFLDVREMLSVQVHPRDDQPDLIPVGDTGKTEAWVVLEADPAARIYAGLKPGVTAADLRGLTAADADDRLSRFSPKVGQGVPIEAGTVHSLGDGVMVFEIQENSDVTFRLYDWDHVDARTGRPRDLQVDQAMACVDFGQGEISPVTPVLDRSGSPRRELYFDTSHFQMWRLLAEAPFTVGVDEEPRILVCLAGEGSVQHGGGAVAMVRGAVILLPACLGPCRFRPAGAVTLLEIAIPEHP
jgi:mannose-6-phosphate isomerase